MPRAIRTYIALLAVAAVTMITAQLTHGPELPIVEFLFFLALFVLAEFNPVLLPKIALSVTFLIEVVAIIQLPPAAVALLAGSSYVGSLLSGEKRPVHKTIFNIAQLALAGGLAAQAYRWLGGPTVVTTAQLPNLVLAVGAATVVNFLVNSACVAGAISLSSGAKFLRTWMRNYGWLPATYIAFGGFGIVLAGLYQAVGILSLPLLLVPLLVARSIFRSYQEVSNAYESTIKAFVTAIEAKDAYTRGHSERVAEYAMLIARRVGMEEEQLRAFWYSALLHDVGKLAIRTSVLVKPSRLEAEEYDEIKRHPVLGAQIVQEIEFLRSALDGVLYHHERLDGSGYPAGLAGDVVPDAARIMAIADTFDAMTSTRAYRGARTAQEAIDELRRFAGSQYDERYVELFIEALHEESLPVVSEERGYAREPVAVPAA